MASSSIPKPVLLEYLASAVEEPLGLFIRTTNVNDLKNQFYAALTSAGISIEDTSIMICVPSAENTIYLLHRSVELEP